jgi:hypothetical protein
MAERTRKQNPRQRSFFFKAHTSRIRFGVGMVGVASSLSSILYLFSGAFNNHHVADLRQYFCVQVRVLERREELDFRVLHTGKVGNFFY